MRANARLSLPSLTMMASIVLLAGGCSSMSGGFFSSGSSKLTALAEDLRNAAPVAAPLPRELERTVLPAYYVEPSDVLLVQPADFESTVRLPTDQPVLPDGTIDLGRYGSLQVAGKTVEEIAAEVQNLVEQTTPNAGKMTVRLVGRQSKVFYVLGEVNSPGVFPLTGRETVLDAIIAAGGLTNQANQAKIVYSQPTPAHSCRVVLPICYRDIVQLGDTSTNYQLAPGDRIYVPSLSFCEQFCDVFRSKPAPECPPCGQCQTPCPLVSHGQHPADYNAVSREMPLESRRLASPPAPRAVSAQ